MSEKLENLPFPKALEHAFKGKPIRRKQWSRPVFLVWVDRRNIVLSAVENQNLTKFFESKKISAVWTHPFFIYKSAQNDLKLGYDFSDEDRDASDWEAIDPVTLEVLTS